MTAERPRPALASVTIRRLVLPDGAAGHGLGEAIAAALSYELRGGVEPGPRFGLARAIARDIATHPGTAAAGGNADEGR